MEKPRIALYDFTDCEGCEVKFVSLREKVLWVEKKCLIVNWRLGQDYTEPGPYDLALIEGNPLTHDEIGRLKQIRENSKIVVALGSCASLGGISAIMPVQDRTAWYVKIYGKEYQPRGVDALPLHSYVKVDYSIHGCPVDENEILRTIEEVVAGKFPRYHDYSVCFECKIAGNPCRIIEKKPCLGPITQGGCKAVCVSGGSPCYGCFGLREAADIPGLIKILKNFADDQEIKRSLTMFHNRTEEIVELVNQIDKGHL